MENLNLYTSIVTLFCVVSLLAIVFFAKRKKTIDDKRTIDELSKIFREETDRSRNAIRQEISAFREELNNGNESRSRTLNEALSARSRESNDLIIKHLGLLAETQAKQSEFIAGTLSTNRTEISKTFLEIREALEKSLTLLRTENAKKLDEMRGVVDEKLQTTLEKRIGESFKQVTERLENVHKSLGEMQIVSANIGDLKRVLTNVKSRGTWGEVQLGSLLENILVPEQFEKNVKTNPRGNTFVEFAIKLPGGSENGFKPVYLPIDSKFPTEDYERIVKAANNADTEGVERAGTQLGKVVESCAKDIRDKYICVPNTTNFGILFLPTEGLYAEVLRRPGLVEKIQQEMRVLIAGPTTLAALLNSLQIGFRTLAIQKNSAEIAKTLVLVKKDFAIFGEQLARAAKKIDDAKNSIANTEERHRITTNKLEKFELLDEDSTQQ